MNKRLEEFPEVYGWLWVSVAHWLDWWHLDGVLYTNYGPRMVYDAARNIEMKLSRILKDNDRSQPLAR